MLIAIDIGHAAGTGARGNGQEEHAVCSAIAACLARRLQALGHGAVVVDFPEMDNRGDLVATVRAVNAGGYDACVSLHCDAADKIVGYSTHPYPDGTPSKKPVYAPNPEPRGAHVCYVSEAGGRLAEVIAARLCPLLPGRANRTVRRRDLFVLRRTVCPAVLVECGFVTNAHDAQLQRDGAEAIAEAIACGVDDYAEGVSA